MQLIVEDKKTVCPHCGSSNCFQEDHVVGENKVSSYLCMSCGYTTTTLNTSTSQYITSFEETCPTLFTDIKFHDKETDLVWYPTVLNFPDKGLVFPDGTSRDDWQWRAVPYTPVDEDEKEKYPVPNKPGEFYQTKANMQLSKLFGQTDFQEGCKFLGIIEA